MLAELLKSKEFQQRTKDGHRLKTLIPWATLSGCPKCRHAVNGSSCCNPEKMLARDLALKEKPSKDGKVDKELYAKKLLEVYAKLKESHVSPVAVTELPKKGGGGQKGRWIWARPGKVGTRRRCAKTVS